MLSGHKKKISPSMSDQEKIYHMCNPHPKPLLQGKKTLIRHGSLDYFSPNTVSRKSRYLFLFNDALLIAKREGPQKFWLRIYIHLRSGNCHIVPMWDSPEFEFRLLIDEKGTLEKRKQRRIILYGQNRAHKQAWLDDLMHYHWECTGRQGPDPAPPRRAEDDARSRREEEKEKPTAPKAKPKPQETHREEPPREARPDEGNPLLLFDPFAVDDSSADYSSYKGVDAAGHAIPKGVMLEPAGTDPSAYTPAPVYAGTAGYAPGYGGAGYAYAGQGVGPAGYPVGYDPTGLYAAATDTTAALGGMFATAPGGASAGGAGGVGVGGAGVGASGVGAGGAAGGGVPSEFKDNLDEVAQRELQEASKAIEEIAAALAARKRKAPVRAPDAADDTPITVEEVSEAILDATQAIARAASALMRAAAQAQQERMKHYASQPSGTPYHADPAWANGLVSAARSVVGTTQHLVGVANAAANGQAQEEALVASARAVGAATAQLVSAQRAKSDLTSGANHGLEEAAKGISTATSQLVHAAQVAFQPSSPAPTPAASAPSKYTLTEKQIREIEAQTQVLEYEKKAREAREKLLEMRKNEYKEF